MQVTAFNEYGAGEPAVLHAFTQQGSEQYEKEKEMGGGRRMEGRRERGSKERKRERERERRDCIV